MKLTTSKKFALIATAIIERDFKSEYLFCMFSVVSNLVTSHQFHSIFCYYAVTFLANYGTVPYSLILTPIAALPQAVLQRKTEPFRNGERPLRIDSINGQYKCQYKRTVEQDSINVSKRCPVRPDVNFSMKPWIPFIFSFNLMNLLAFPTMGKHLIFFIIIIY